MSGLGFEFTPYERAEAGRSPLLVVADHGLAANNNLVPVIDLVQTRPSGIDVVELTEEEIVWLRDDVFPTVLERMRAAKAVRR